MPPRRRQPSPTATTAPTTAVTPVDALPTKAPPTAAAPTMDEVAVTVPAEKQTAAEQQMSAANDLFKDGEFLKAAGMYTKATKSDPTNPIGFCNLAYALLKVNKFDKAIAAADKCLELDPNSFKGHFRKGIAQYGALMFEEAVDSFATAASTSPENSPARREAQKMKQRAAWACKKGAEKEQKEVPSNSADASNPDEEKENLTPKEKMAKTMNTHRQQRVRKNVQLAMNKVVAASEAIEELEEQTPFGAGKRVSTVASEIPEEEIAKLSSEEEVIAVKKELMEGEQVSYDAERVARFAAKEMAALRDPKNRSQYAHPIAIFLPGSQKEGWGDEGSGVGMRGAFDTQKTYTRMPDFLRDWAAKTLAHGVLIVVPKSQVSYPAVWKGDAKWPCADEVDGYICQLETPESAGRMAYFVELGDDGKTTTVHDLDPMTQCILPPIYQKIQAKTNKEAVARQQALKASSKKKKSGKKKAK